MATDRIVTYNSEGTHADLGSVTLKLEGGSTVATLIVSTQDFDPEVHDSIEDVDPHEYRTAAVLLPYDRLTWLVTHGAALLERM